ncbi:hypothetical protein SAMD00019534_057600 [Acytostelium subglobosum LB1]|uniref:hypothetical protein n=1 Tax=Acytostelium subglobosum LB1 TaxID=1410327 RepID=UPI000644890D|nr:hypothetical protein SAMD00019534_057600 [Acytostelium subglobosum LB1]GAM22585.1 hypothetical protein SAMD00019534_057600 [Acytostelium subglobosum LB1]|eukprot:XP_012754705.1 hypothetical protein SAMD00019534_057600 [Acytostelium subglobosum LB1]
MQTQTETQLETSTDNNNNEVATTTTPYIKGSNIIDFNGSKSFEIKQATANHSSLLLVYRPDCVFSIQAMPMYITLAHTFPNLTFYRADLLSNKLKTRSTPTIFLVREGYWLRYGGSMDIVELKEWISDRCDQKYNDDEEKDNTVSTKVDKESDDDNDDITEYQDDDGHSIIMAVQSIGTSINYMLVFSTCFVIYLCVKTIIIHIKRSMKQKIH